MSAPLGRRGLALLLVVSPALAAGSASPAADRPSQKADAIKNWSGRFTRRGQQKTFTFKTPLDGVFASQLRGPRGSTVQVIGPADVKRVSPTVSAALVCGQRTVTTRLVAGGKGRFAAAAAIP
jgi:hypothetical protein